jgi:hypothetical protein
VLPLYDFQHILNNPALRINRHRSLNETVLMSLGSVVSSYVTNEDSLLRADRRHIRTLASVKLCQIRIGFRRDVQA